MKVAVVGLGAAGLRTAMLLEGMGHEVLPFEARDRLGGRIHTVDQGGGALYDAGGEWIDADHERCIGLLSDLDLEPEATTSGVRHFVCQGDRRTEHSVWQEVLEDDLRFEAAARALCDNLRMPVWVNTHLSHLDEASLATLIDQNARSPKGRWYLTARALSDEGDDPDQIGLLGWLGFLYNYLQRGGQEMSAFRIPGGAGRLIERMSARLAATPRLGMELLRASQTDRAVQLSFGNGQTVEVDRAVITLPPRPLERIVFQPALQPAKRCAIEACRMSPVVKVCLEFKTAWWRDQGWGGSMQCDLAFQQTWDGTRDSAPILTAYVCGRGAQAFSAADDPVQMALDELIELFPDAQGKFRRGWIHDWIRDPLAGGGFSQMAPGFVLQHARHIATPEARIHFAGEHTASWTGFIEGALESAERVAAEIHASGG